MKVRGELDDMSNGGLMREEGEWFGWELRDLNFFLPLDLGYE